MKILHTSDLHLGKKLHGYDLLEEQALKLKQILEYVKNNSIKALILAGDIFDTSLATDEAIKLFNRFLSDFIRLGNVHLFVIAGNHDSRIRLGNKAIYESLNPYIHFATTINDIEKIEIDDVTFTPIPFLKIEDINNHYNQKFTSLNEAFKYLLDSLALDKSKKSVLICHQAVNPISGNYLASDSEVKQIGGEDIISTEVFNGYSYVALGHIHMPQKISDNVYYSGSIFKYHYNESSQNRSFLVVDTNDFAISKEEFNLIHDVKLIKGFYQELLEKSSDDYVFFELFDEDIILHAADNLKVKYKNFLGLRYKESTKEVEETNIEIDFSNKDYLDIFKEFYLKIRDKEISDEELEIMKSLFNGDSNEAN